MKREIVILFTLLFIIMISVIFRKNNIYGNYTFDDLIILSPLSSWTNDYYIEKNEETQYIIQKKYFKILFQDGQNFEIKNPLYKKEEMNEALINKFNTAVTNKISLKNYKEKYQITIYNINNENSIHTFRLFLLDDEIWLALYYNIDEDIIAEIVKLKPRFS